eukprot:2410294-Pyramimonas_sp.AAC.1
MIQDAPRWSSPRKNAHVRAKPGRREFWPFGIPRGPSPGPGTVGTLLFRFQRACHRSDVHVPCMFRFRACFVRKMTHDAPQ